MRTKMEYIWCVYACICYACTIEHTGTAFAHDCEFAVELHPSDEMRSKSLGTLFQLYTKIRMQTHKMLGYARAEHRLRWWWWWWCGVCHANATHPRHIKSRCIAQRMREGLRASLVCCGGVSLARCSFNNKLAVAGRHQHHHRVRRYFTVHHHHNHSATDRRAQNYRSSSVAQIILLQTACITPARPVQPGIVRLQNATMFSRVHIFSA